MSYISRFIRALYRWFPRLLAANRFKIDSSARCPACGIYLAHVIKWNAGSRLVVHTCIRCAAEFAQDAVISPDKWIKKAIAEAEK